jgi:dTDP-4-amino-4,6-dideoxygalactose transaminase
MSDSIPLIEPVVGDEEVSNMQEVLDSGYMTQGPFADDFEGTFSEAVDAEHGITATSCTTGMELALEAVGVGEGDEVIVPDFTHPATANAVVRVGAEPVLVDVDRRTYNIDYDEMESAVGPDTEALLPVSWGGQPLNADRVNKVAEENDLAVVEDAACAAGASFDDEAVGSQFDVSAFSFHPRKVLAVGEAGMVTTDSDEIEENVREIKNFGADLTGDTVDFVRADATNYRLSDVLAAIGVEQVKKMDEIVKRRREIAQTYTDMFEDVEGIIPPYEPDEAYHNYQCYCVYVEAGDNDKRDEIIEEMAEKEIETQIGTYALHQTSAFEDAKSSGNLDDSYDLYKNLLTLPVAHTMTEEDQKRVYDELTAAI